ncbi:MAG: 4a-hydroxytetrahydrobiopterin dehydratase [Acetobacteraceae bacterium]
MAATLSIVERAELARSCPQWRTAKDQDAIERSFQFKDFSEAWGFMSRVALLAEQHQHHPDWSNAWSKVEIRLSTHDAGGLTANDAALARAIDGLRAGG